MTFLSLGNWLKLRQRQSKVCRSRPRRHDRILRARFVPRLEVLEDRCLLSGGISLTPSEAAPQLVGEPITWTATVPKASPDVRASLAQRPRPSVEPLEDRFMPSGFAGLDVAVDHFQPDPTEATPFKVLHTYHTSFAAEVANTIPVSAEKLMPLLPDEYSLVPAAALGLGSWDQGIVAIANFRGDNPQVDHRKPGQAQQVAIDVLILVNEPAEAATLGVNIPGAFHLYTLAIYTNDPQYAASLRVADMPVQFVPGITYDRLMNDATGVGDVNVAVPAKGSPFYSFNTGFGYGPAGALDTVFWHDGKHGKAVLHFHDEPFQQGQALSQIYTQPGSKWDNLLSGGGLGPGTTDPVTGYHSIVTPSLNFRYGQGTSGRLMLIAPPACVESVVVNDGSGQRLSNGNDVFPSGFQGQAPKFFGQAIEVRPDGDDSRGLSREERPRVHGRPSAEAPVGDAQSSAQPDIGTSASLAAPLTTSSRLLALPSTPTAPTPEDVWCLDQFFAASLEDGTSFVLPRSRRNPLSLGDEDGADATPSGREQELADKTEPQPSSLELR